MATDYVYLGPTPAEESCQQAGTASYDPNKARAECRAYKHQLQRLVEAKGLTVELVIKREPYEDFSYLEVAARFDDEDEPAREAAYWLEDNSPANWDEEARAELTPGTIGNLLFSSGYGIAI